MELIQNSLLLKTVVLAAPLIFYPFVAVRFEASIWMRRSFLAVYLFLGVFSIAELIAEHSPWYALFSLAGALFVWSSEEKGLHSGTYSIAALFLIFVHSAFDGMTVNFSDSVMVMVGMFFHRVIFEGALWNAVSKKKGKKQAVVASAVNVCGLILGAVGSALWIPEMEGVHAFSEAFVAGIMLHLFMDGLFHERKQDISHKHPNHHH